MKKRVIAFLCLCSICIGMIGCATGNSADMISGAGVLGMFNDKAEDIDRHRYNAFVREASIDVYNYANPQAKIKES